MPADPNTSLNLMLGWSAAPLTVANAYFSQLERGSIHSPHSHDRALSRALNTFNTQWFNLGLDAVSASRQAIRQAEDLGLPSALLSATDQVLSQQEASLRATARKVVRMAYAY
ncbi:hypothetical protein WIT60_11710 [Aquabacterium sp. G14]|uniref:hypothetical protein n=1 Tax=Aquabacterium sp. G14 TaxID=3130164 RepID=UPI0030A7B809